MCSGSLQIFNQKQCIGVIPIKPGEVGIGRDPINDVCLPGLQVSRRHASVLIDGKTVIFKDHSTFGSIVGGKHIHKACVVLEHGSTVILGDYRLIYNELALDVYDRNETLTVSRKRTRELSQIKSLKFVILSGKQADEIIHTKGHVTTIGSDSKNHVYLPEAGIKPLHVQITCDEGGVFLHTFGDVVVNGERVAPFSSIDIRPGSIMVIAGVKLAFQWADDASDSYPYNIVTRAPVMLGVIHQVEQTARYPDIPVLILGETGTGKELVAKAIHEASKRAIDPFITVNCSALPENLAESMLFGHVEGAFTSASRNHKGFFQMADGGTLFLDEIGELKPDIQVKLLRAIEYKEISPVGAKTPLNVNVRIVAATHRMIDQESHRREMKFRDDLFYRISGLVFAIPPLRERQQDITLLMDYFLDVAKLKYSVNDPIIYTESAYAAANSNPWPGNIRELYHACLKGFISRASFKITERSFLPAGSAARNTDPIEIIKEMINSGMSPTEVAKKINVSRGTVYNRLKKAVTKAAACQ